LEALRERYEGRVIGVIAFRQGLPGIPPAQQLVLSPSGDPGEAARNLFAGMRRLDSLPLDLIIAELVPEAGLGRAINDRLKRAAAAE
jgi:L-threonylcarbamoyladenylate synthase